MTEEMFDKSECYKINRRHFLPKNYWPGCRFGLQFKLF